MNSSIIGVMIAVLIAQLYRKRPIGETVLVVIAAGGAAFGAGEAVKWAMNPNPEQAIEQGFKQAVAQIKPTLPKELDDATTLVDVAYSGVVLTYYHKIKSDAYELSPDFIQKVQASTTEAACKTTMTKSMSAGAIFRYSYSGSKSEYLGTFDVKAGDCK